MLYGCSSEVGEIKSILLKHPNDAFISQEKIDSQWKNLNYIDRVNFDKAFEEYEKFVDILGQYIPEVYFLEPDDNTGLDSIYVRDSVLITKKGAILCCMGKEQRLHEPEATGEFLKKADIHVLGAVTGDGKLEGGDVILLDEKTLAVGLGYRTNEAGIGRLKELTSGFIDEIVVVHLPHYKGPDDVFHLMSIISPVDRDLAVVYSKLMPVCFREWLINRGIKLIEVPDSEFESMGCNILTVAPRVCVMLEGNPVTKSLLVTEGVKVLEYKGDYVTSKKVIRNVDNSVIRELNL